MKLNFYIFYIFLSFPLFLHSQCSDLFISEYIEGSSNNKYLEIYNPTTASINLTGYNVQIYFNGSGTASSTINLSGTLAAGAVYIIENSGEALGVTADLSTGSLSFNGDDAVALRNGTTIIDVIGQIGFDPGAQWGAGLQSTQDNTIRRKVGIQLGDANGADAFDPSIEWDGFAQDDISGLGSHVITPCVICTPETEPTLNTSRVTVTPSCTSVNINFTSGNGTNRIIVMSQSCPLSATPLDQTAYTAGSFGSGSTIGVGNFVVFNGTASSTTISGLNSGTTYCFTVFEYNVTTDNCTENYLTTGVVSTSFTTNSSGCVNTSGGLVVNEFSNGSSGAREYMEFLVVGDPCTTVDLRGWIFDDNNGIDNSSCDGFSLDDCDVGIAPGHVRFRNIARWSAVPVGAIILVYNSADKNTSITISDDPTDSNSDLVYVLPITDSGLEGTSLLPSSPNNCGDVSYVPGNCIYGPSTYSSPANWSVISLNNTRDACQTRSPDGSFFHGFSYGTTNMTGGVYRINFNTNGTSNNFYLNCGSSSIFTDYSTGSALTDETPGSPNSALNQELVNYYRGVGGCGLVPPCVTILSVKLQAFNAKNEDRSVRLDWQLASSDTEYFTFELQRSSDAVDFYTIALIDGHSSIESYLHYDREPMAQNYYRLKITDANGEVTYSQIRNLNFESDTEIQVYPNPLRGSRQLTVLSESNVESVEFFNTLGQKVYNEISPMQQIDLPHEMSAGFYTLLIHTENGTQIRKLVVE